MAAYPYKLTVRVFRPGLVSRAQLGMPTPENGVTCFYVPEQRGATKIRRYAGYVDTAIVDGLLDDFESHFRVDGEATGYP